MDISNHPVEGKDNLVRFTAYSLLKLDIKFKPNYLGEDLRLLQACKDVSANLANQDDSVSRSLEEAKRIFEVVKSDSSTLWKQLKKERMDIAMHYSVPLN